MDVLKKYSKRSFWVVTIYGLAIGGGVCAGAFYGVRWLLDNFFTSSGGLANAGDLEWVFNQCVQVSQKFYQMTVPAVVISVLVLFWLLWLLIRLSVAGVSSETENDKNLQAGKPKKKDFIDQKIEQERKRRVFLHTLSVLQREGRLIDFLQEDLGLYDDEQIGAAVRSIQEDCKKTLKKYIAPKPVIETEEGKPITIEQGFDLDSIKLVGNVSGEPPFKGVVKHAGWKAGKKDIPKLSDVHDTTIITPAEIEIE